MDQRFFDALVVLLYFGGLYLALSWQERRLKKQQRIQIANDVLAEDAEGSERRRRALETIMRQGRGKAPVVPMTPHYARKVNES